ncbi:MAG: adenylyl-sulfate kinase [Nitrospira sp.]|nr:adenylyl-sulfate kinase [Nitrospira sp.]
MGEERRRGDSQERTSIPPREAAFAIWLTGLPASGKSSIAAVLKPKLEAAGHVVEVLESDAVRQILTPAPTYAAQERDLFYRALAFMGSRLVAHGIAVIFDATANRRSYRDFARSLIRRFIEVAVVCPLELCMQRDYKGTYQRGRLGESTTVPGLQDPYEAPFNPEVTIDTTKMTAEEAARTIFTAVYERSR